MNCRQWLEAGMPLGTPFILVRRSMPVDGNIVNIDQEIGLICVTMTRAAEHYCLRAGGTTISMKLPEAPYFSYTWHPLENPQITLCADGPKEHFRIWAGAEVTIE